MKPEDVRNLPDRVLVDRFRARGEDRFFEEFVRRYTARLFGVCWHILRNRQDSEDVVQEAFLRAYRGIEAYEGGDFFSWLKAIGTNCLFLAQGNRDKLRSEPLAQAEKRVQRGRSGKWIGTEGLPRSVFRP